MVVNYKMDRYVSCVDLCMEYLLCILTCKNIKKNGLLNEVSDTFYLSTKKHNNYKNFLIPIENLNRFYLTGKYSYDKNICESADYIYFILKDNSKYYIMITYINADTSNNDSMINITLYKNNKYKYVLSKNLEGKILYFGSYLNYYTVKNDELFHTSYSRKTEEQKIDVYKIEDFNDKNIVIKNVKSGNQYIVIDYKLYSLHKIRQETSSYLYWNIIMFSDGYLNIKD